MDLSHYSQKYYKTLEKLSEKAAKSVIINPAEYANYDVKRGLRDLDGKGVLAGLTYISDIVSFRTGPNGERIPCEGELYYRGYEIKSIISDFLRSGIPGFEESAYLLLFGELPNKKKLDEFMDLLRDFRQLPRSFVRDIIMKAPSNDMMNALARSVLSLYYYDNRADDISINNILRQSIQLISQLPMIAVYSYQVSRYYSKDKSLIIHQPNPNLSLAENILYMLRADKEYTETEARMLDVLLVLHQEHGGGNNSTFATHLVSSSGTDTYSCIAGSLGSLKGPRHGGANIKVVRMFEDMKMHLKDYSDSSISEYLLKVLNKEAFDKTGLIYGMGHAVYSISDPRADIVREYAEILAKEKGKEEEFNLYTKVAKIAPEIILETRKIYKGVAPNIDFYSGFAYSMLDIPEELFTPLFAIARMVGWSAHRIEEIANGGKIIRPGYVNIQKHLPYIKMEDRK